LGYYDIFDLFENRGWRDRSSREGGRLVMRQGVLVCPFCLKPFTRAEMEGEDAVRCPSCLRAFRPDDATR